MTAPRESALIPSLREEWNGPEWGSWSAYSLSLPPLSMGGQKATPSPVYSPCSTKYGRFLCFLKKKKTTPSFPRSSSERAGCASEKFTDCLLWQWDRLHSHLLTTRVLKAMGSICFFQYGVKALEAWLWKEADISFCLSRLVMSRVAFKQWTFVLI